MSYPLDIFSKDDTLLSEEQQLSGVLTAYETTGFVFLCFKVHNY